jgi:hypothetical protein
MIKQFLRITMVGIALFSTSHARSPFRPKDPLMPRIEAQWQGDPITYTMHDYHLTENAIFKTFDEKFFHKHILPNGEISYRNAPAITVSGATLKALIDNLIDEISSGRKNFTHFTILRNRDFNASEQIGLMILKFNDYPFVVKLFMETPKSLSNRYAKGMVPLFLFYMGGGINRHLIGFTRIKNLENIKHKIKHDPYWSTIVDTPRKWFVHPKKSRSIVITGYNMGITNPITTRLPGIYCIIADAIETNKKTSMFNKIDNHTCINLCKFLDFGIDPHIDNFMWESATNKLVVVDTEHFPTLIGFKEIKIFDSYFEWLFHLTGKFLGDTFFRSKHDRRIVKPSQHATVITT